MTNKYMKPNQSGQTLLVLVMLLATALTVVLSISFKTTTDTQITKLEEESQKALAASEAAIEKTINENTGIDVLNFSQIGVTFPGINSTASTIEISEFPQDDKFVTPLLQQDEQYTFYLTDYNITTRTLGTSYYTGNLIINFESSTDTPALELTFIKSDNTVTKMVADPGDQITSVAGSELTISPGQPVNNVNFSHSVTVSGTNTKLLIVRSLFAGTRLGFEGTVTPLKPQGISRIPNTILNTGASKKINFFQSYPQFPSGPLINLFVTSF